ncbi:MAG: DNA repair protein RecN (Recombination protein N) [Candidatus Deianiraeaceae bacterium]|jgi:DNA repair protein RecN (Recombination protein N)
MLKRLVIENVVLIKSACLEFSGGLCALTGETGAGKSIVLNSILTLIGKETKVKSLLRHGCKYGSIEGVFVDILEETERLLLENAITPTNELTIKCIVQESGGSRYFINNQQVLQSLVEKVGNTLIEINRQHEQTFLMDEKNHIKILDEYANNTAILQELAEKYREIQICEKEIQETIERNKKVSYEIEYLKETQQELKNAEIGETEYDELQEKRIQNKKRHNTFETLTSAQCKLEGASVGQVLMNVHRMITPIATEETETLSETIDRICIDIQEVEGVIHSLIEKNYINISEIDKDEERFFLLQDLSRKYKTQPFILYQYTIEVERKIEGFNKTEESIAELNKHKELLEGGYLALAQTLRKKRNYAGGELIQKINASLSDLQMDGASFRIEFSETKMKKNGMDSVYFVIETNKNMGFGKLALIASGGEISRIVLAIKGAIAHLRQTPCVIFDEIDTGISGKTSNAVGDVMLKLANNMQIIVITHQPQVAAKACDHFCISKKHQYDETETKVEKLTQDERMYEIARLLSGAKISQEALSNAKILLGQ